LNNERDRILDVDAENHDARLRERAIVRKNIARSQFNAGLVRFLPFPTFRSSGFESLPGRNAAIFLPGHHIGFTQMRNWIRPIERVALAVV